MRVPLYFLLGLWIFLSLWRIGIGQCQGWRLRWTRLGSQILMKSLNYWFKRETSSQPPSISTFSAPHPRIGPIGWTRKSLILISGIVCGTLVFIGPSWSPEVAICLGILSHSVNCWGDGALQHTPSFFLRGSLHQLWRMWLTSGCYPSLVSICCPISSCLWKKRRLQLLWGNSRPPDWVVGLHSLSTTRKFQSAVLPLCYIGFVSALLVTFLAI